MDIVGCPVHALVLKKQFKYYTCEQCINVSSYRAMLMRRSLDRKCYKLHVCLQQKRKEENRSQTFLPNASPLVYV